ncbi:MAG: D-alanyl-D-alanine carboxypeptidase [Nocardiopsaceae bacterium]|nr:D-alanyl-D-alanine carboxypeptidase [Nocardiopsaceae bacterium]
MRRAVWVLAGTVAVLAFLVILAGMLVLRPLPAFSLATSRVAPAQPGPPGISWPQARQAAVAVDGVGKTWSSGGHAEIPVASVAKMMTAYVVLRDHPLSAAAQGPSIPVTAKDAAQYKKDVKRGDSTAKVAKGHPLTERQALEALLLPSADNVAELLARWDAGSVASFAAKMNSTARSLGMDHTRYTDPAGLAASTVSTALDQLTLVRTAMKVPAFASIVAMPSARIPVAGVIANYNRETGTNGIIGVKTGSDSAARGCWAFAVKRQVGGTRRVVYGVVLGAPAPGTEALADLASAAVSAGVRLADAMSRTVRTMTVLPAGTVVGTITVPWSKAPVRVVTARALRGQVVAGTHVSLSYRMRGLGAATAFSRGTTVGEYSASGLTGTVSTPVVTAGPSGSPSAMWRLFRS